MHFQSVFTQVGEPFDNDVTSRNGTPDLVINLSQKKVAKLLNTNCNEYHSHDGIPSLSLKRYAEKLKSRNSLCTETVPEGWLCAYAVHISLKGDKFIVEN